MDYATTKKQSPNSKVDTSNPQMRSQTVKDDGSVSPEALKDTFENVTNQNKD